MAAPAAGISLNANNQALTFAGTTMAYDLNGNLATAQDAGGTATYTWDVRNRLTSLTAPGFAATFAYDALGRRTGKTVQGVTTNFVYDGLNPVQEKNGSTITANLLTGLGIDQLFTRTDGAGTSEFFTDALGSTVALANTSGTVQTSYTYEPFGGTTQTGTASSNSFKYTGREDDGTGLLYYRARYYSPRLQRFISEDPIGFDGGDANLYGYVGGDPVKWVDPLGFVGEIPSIPNPNDANIPGGPWEPRKGMNPGSFQGPKLPGGGRNMCEYVPANKDAPEPYWKVNEPGKKGWQRYWPGGQPISPEIAHPGNPPASIPPLRGLQPLFIFPWQIPSILNPGGGGQVPPA